MFVKFGLREASISSKGLASGPRSSTLSHRRIVSRRLCFHYLRCTPRLTLLSQHLVQLLTLHPTRPSPTPHLYLAQTAPTPRDALASYEAALTILQSRLEALQSSEVPAEEETEEEVKKECVMVFVAMVEIWMSDLWYVPHPPSPSHSHSSSARSFEPDAPAQCNALITRALHLSPNDPDALLTLASIRMSESRPAEAKEIVVAVADRVIRIAEHLDAKEETEVTAPAEMDTERDLELPPIQTRSLLARLLLEHEEYARALRMVETIRGEDDEDVEGCYLEGWGWYCRAKAMEEAEAAGVKPDEAGMTVEECHVEALSALLECQSVRRRIPKYIQVLTCLFSYTRNRTIRTRVFSRTPMNSSPSSRARECASRWKTRKGMMLKCSRPVVHEPR
jgi:hypothetical protein